MCSGEAGTKEERWTIGVTIFYLKLQHVMICLNSTFINAAHSWSALSLWSTARSKLAYCCSPHWHNMEYISKLCQTAQMRSKHFGLSAIVNHNRGKAVIWLCIMLLPRSNIKTTNVRSQLLACNTSEAMKAPGMNGSASVLPRSSGYSHLFEQSTCRFSFIPTCFFKMATALVDVMRTNTVVEQVGRQTHTHNFATV